MFGLPVPIIGLIVAVAVLVYLVLRTRVHAFIAMLIASAIAGLVGGLNATETLAVISKGFGGTLGSIGIIVRDVIDYCQKIGTCQFQPYQFRHGDASCRSRPGPHP